MRTLAALFLSLTLAATAQTSHHHSTQPADKTDKLVFTLILSRHGIRPPLVANTTLDTYATDPWPVWEVPMGHLTPHGAEAIASMGAYLRLNLVEHGLMPAAGCPTPSDIYLYADTDERNIDSTRSTFNAFAPNCEHLDVNMPAPNTANKKDPLFSPVPTAFPVPSGDAATNALRATLHNNPDFELSPRANPELNTFARILAPDPAHPPAKPILNVPITFTMGEYGMGARGPLATASNVIEDLELEFVDAKPLSEVGWGRVGATEAAANAELQRLLQLHVKAFSLGLRTPMYARAEGSNILAHILATLQQAATASASTSSGHSPSGPWTLGPGPLQSIGPPQARLVYLSGHDSNIFAVAGLLNLHWRADGRTDDTPPDSQLVFELWQHPGAKDLELRIRYRAQTLMQLRTAETLTLDHPPVEVELTPPGCASPSRTPPSRATPHCPLPQFLHAARQRLDPAFVLPNLVPTQVAP